MRLLSRTALPLVVACGAVLVPTSSAAAAEPERASWWNRLSAAGASLPQPTTQPGDLRVAAGPDAPSAWSGLLYTAPGSSSATLDLEVREGSAVGTLAVVACPTTTTDWPEGENLPAETAPPYDCDAGLAFGSLSEDGTTLSFLLDSSTQVEPGVWSLALVPEPGSSAGVFSVDLVRPDGQAFQAEPPPVESSEPVPDPGSTGTDGSSTGSGEALMPGGFEPPPVAAGTAELSPMVAGGADAPLPAAAAPAPSLPAAAPGAATPVLLARPASVSDDLGSGRRLLALLVLAGGSAAVGYAAGQQRPGPRLIGGRSRLGVAAPAAVPTTAETRPRGIGRFARTRDAAPRRLR